MQMFDCTRVPPGRQDCKIFIKAMWEAKNVKNEKDSALRIIHRQEYVVLNIICGSDPLRSENADTVRSFEQFSRH